MSKHITKLLDEHDLTEVTGVVHAMTAHFGGFNQLVRRWKESLDNAPKDSLFALRSLNVVLHLTILLSDRQDHENADWLRHASDEELQEAATTMREDIAGKLKAEIAQDLRAKFVGTNGEG